MANPFEAEGGTFFVLENEEMQLSLWPQFIDVPAGWGVAYGPDTRARCLEYVEDNWVDMRPRSLVRKMNEAQRR